MLRRDKDVWIFYLKEHMKHRVMQVIGAWSRVQAPIAARDVYNTNPGLSPEHDDQPSRQNTLRVHAPADRD